MRGKTLARLQGKFAGGHAGGCVDAGLVGIAHHPAGLRKQLIDRLPGVLFRPQDQPLPRFSLNYVSFVVRMDYPLDV